MKSKSPRINNLIRICILLFSLVSCTVKQEISARKEQLVDKVYPLLDTENSRWFFFSSASRPFGMVNLSPDTQINGAWGSGYRYKTDTIKGFSHIHAWQLSGLSVMPVIISGSKNGIYTDFYSKFSHEKESVRPGYHSVELDRYGIKAELTSTKRVGFHKYRFPGNKKGHVLFNLNTVLGSCENTGGILEKTGSNELSGKLVAAPTTRRPKPLTVYFKVRFNVSITTVERDPGTGNYLVALDTSDEAVLMKAGISYTSAENAANNIQKELPHWDFNRVIEDSGDEWNELLGRIKVEGGTEKAQRRFYTDLWHALQGRRIINDVNGEYPDNTGKQFRIGRLPLRADGTPEFNHYNSDSFWGAQWTINTLWGLAYPEIMHEFTYSLMQYYKDGGMIPRGPSGGNYTFVMTGASTTPFMVSAIQKGIVKDSLEIIYKALKKNHMPGGIMEKAGYEHHTHIGGGLNYYIKNGYIPYPLPEGMGFGGHQDGSGQTLEYAYQDWALAQLAKKIKYKEDYAYFMKRAANYKNVFNEKVGWMAPKNVNGRWKNDFDPYQYENGFVESNAAQSTWFVPHDIGGLATLMGGKEKATEKLLDQFRSARELGFTSGNSHEAELHPEYSRIPVNYGNQPSIQTAFIFNQLDHPDLTQYWSRQVVERVFSDLTPSEGYKGDEDQGLMGSLAVLMKIGLFQMNGGTENNPEYQIGSPVFDRITIHLNKDYYPGRIFEIKTVNNGTDNVFVNEVQLNNSPVKSFKIKHEDIIKGGVLQLQMSGKSHKDKN
ncbi:glycoside hydrolase family 92 protein [Sinomicrobium pectinilyticum]|uniref:Glycoside hydrolase family 92 protein n=1 Tax=Sinomicrobium pectinilyticum TaxID=1084421 RepID=A0A3N0EJ57_SINP1|nr:GH92 family glycosyl hydrolase [Sinomicrobium pectinilyticum]RNL87861.1 glycoside hydrolase family 92 protein [Sinomicrobium pectinilyticum]